MTKRHPKHLVCSFCGLHADDVAALVVGPHVYICNSCIELSRETLKNDHPDFEPLDSVQEVRLPNRALKVSEVMAAVAKYHFDTKVQIVAEDEADDIDA